MSPPAKPEERPGDRIAFLTALISVGVIVAASWYLIFIGLRSNFSLGWFVFHPTFNSLAIATFTYAILTLQPTTQPRSKEEGLSRHQQAILGLALPAILFGTSAVSYNKVLHNQPSLTSWHSVFGTLTVTWIIFQILLGGGSVWYGGAAFGRRAKAVWKYHRLSGYLLLPMLFLTAHMGGTWSDYASGNSSNIFRFVAYTVAPVIALASVYSRVRTSKMRFV